MGNNVELNNTIKAMQTFADRKGNNNGKVDTAEEIIIFENLADKKYEEGKLDDAQYTQVMGLYKNEDTNPVTTPKVETDRSSKEFQKADERAFFRVLDIAINDGMSRQEIAIALNQGTFGQVGDTENIKKYNQAIADVMSYMPTYKSAKDVDDKHKDVVEKLQQNGKKDDLHLEVLKKLEKAAKNEFTSSAKTDVVANFETKIKEALAKGDKTQEATINALYAEIDKITDKKEKENAKKAIEQLEKNTVVAKARQYVAEAIQQANKKEFKKEYELENAAKKYLRDNKMWDKYTAKEISRANVVKDSFGEKLIEKTLKGNKVARHKVQTADEIFDELGKNDRELFTMLEANGLISKTADGKYDLTVLSAIIGKLVGADYTLSPSSEENKMIAEKLRTKGKLAVETGLKNLKSREAKELVRLCGYDIEGFDWGKFIAGTAIGTVVNGLIGAGSGALAAATNKDQDVLVEGDTVLNNTTVEIKGDFLGNIDFGSLPEGFEAVQTATGIVIKIKNLIEYPDVYIDISKHITETAVKTALQTALWGAALGALAGMKPDGEKWVTPTQFSETDINKYIERLEIENPKYAQVFTLLAESFIHDGKWDVEAYKQFLNDLAGDGSPLNKEELQAELEKRLNSRKDTTPVVGGGDDCEDPETCTASIKQENTPDTREAKDATHIHHRKGGDTWKGIVEAYYPGLIDKCGGLWGKNGAIKALQRELCTDENGNFDRVKYNKLLEATDLPKEMKMPLHVNGIQRQINGVKAAKFEEAKGNEIKKSLDKVGRDEKVYVVKVGANTYVATDNCDSTQKAVGSSKADALAKLKEKTGKEYANEEELLKD